MKKTVIVILAVLIVFMLLHASPTIALRTEVMLMGYPKAALTSGIILDEYHNKVDKKKFTELHATAYTLTKPPTEKATQGELLNFLVRKIWFLYFAKYYGEP
ncbi:hypothetical protein FZW96_00305 [Bacillus sp. BGMRC 2118]|nr:hypothetical protein FZW96_00305 [Bacillus sp. BGMRC 2118]